MSDHGFSVFPWQFIELIYCFPIIQNKFSFTSEYRKYHISKIKLLSLNKMFSYTYCCSDPSIISNLMGKIQYIHNSMRN